MTSPGILVSNVYAAANGRHPWATALNDIADDLDLWAVQVLGVDKRNGHLTFRTHNGSATPQTALDYFRSCGAIDPRVAHPQSGLAKEHPTATK